jgi:hypothetical protein
MNGPLTQILVLVIGGLLGLVQVLFGLLLKAHADANKTANAGHTETFKRIEARVEQIAERVHALTAIVGKVDQWQRFHDEDKQP